MWFPFLALGRVGLFLVLGIIGPWALARLWLARRGSSHRVTFTNLFGRGELGLVSLGLAAAVIWDVSEAPFPNPLIYAISFVVAAVGVAAASSWIITYCRAAGLGAHDDSARTFRESRSMAFLTFSVALVIEVLLEHAKVVK
jgi:hypothetical protein